MKKSEKIFNELKKNRLVALLTPKSAADCVKAYEALAPLGVSLEVAFRSEHAVEGIKAVVKKYPEALLLAGTVMTREQAESAVRAGASGVVSADYIPQVVDVCLKNDVMCVPGGWSDIGKQLVQKAEGYGCSLEELRLKYPYQWVYKLFPAFSGKVSHMDIALSWQGPYKDVTIIYTGGITLDILREAVLKDPNGIFCASAITKNIDDLERMKKDVEEWKSVLEPRPSEIKRTTLEKSVPAEPFEEFKAVTFGELMARLAPPPGIRLLNTRNFDLNFGGAEANVAVTLARFGVRSVYVTALPLNDIGENALDTLRMHGVETRFIIRKGERMGIYYLEHGSGPKPSKVVYDRAHSSISEVVPEDFDWESIFSGAKWFHWTGITPALSDSVAESLRSALKVAKKKGVTVSADLNYRKKLWSEERARAVMTEFMPFVDILIGNEEDPIRVFGLKPRGTDVAAGKLSLEGYQELAEALVKKFGFKKVAISLRESISASENDWSACLYDGKNFYQSPKYHVWIIDRVGAGDAFAAGLIYSLLKGKTDSEALSFGVAAACLKHSLYGDFPLISVQEVEQLAAGEKTGRIQR